MGLVTPSDFSTRLPFDFIPCDGNNLLGLGDFCFIRFLNWSWFLLTPLDIMGLDRAFCGMSW